MDDSISRADAIAFLTDAIEVMEKAAAQHQMMARHYYSCRDPEFGPYSDDTVTFYGEWAANEATAARRYITELIPKARAVRSRIERRWYAQ